MRIRDILFILIGVLLYVVPWTPALELSDLHLPMTRDDADTSLSKDYESSLLWDGSVRRTWKLDNRTVFMDFNTATNEGVLIAIEYDKPVTLKVGKADADAISSGKLDKTLKWAPPKDNEARVMVREVYGLENAMCMRLSDKSRLFYETDQTKKKIVRVSLFLRTPSTNRWILQQVSPTDTQTAMGNQMTPQHIKDMYADEERRRSIPLKSTSTSTPSSPQIAQGGTDTPSRTTITIQRPGQKTKPTQSQSSSDNSGRRQTPSRHTAMGTTGSAGGENSTDAEKVKIKMDEGQEESREMVFLVDPPDWLKKIGIEHPTWWHYISIAVVLLLLLIMIIRAISRAHASATHRKNFNAVLNQSPQKSPNPEKSNPHKR